MKWLSKLFKKFKFASTELLIDKHNPDCYYTKDEWGGMKLVYKDFESLRKHFARQFDAAKQLSDQQKNDRANHQTNSKPRRT